MLSALHWVNALIFVSIGVLCGFWAEGSAATLGISFTHPSGLTDFRATYGGMCAGLGAFFVVAALVESFAVPAAWLGVAVYLGLGLTRAIGLVLETSRKPMMFGFLVAEIALVVLCLVVPRLAAK